MKRTNNLYFILYFSIRDRLEMSTPCEDVYLLSPCLNQSLCLQLWYTAILANTGRRDPSFNFLLGIHPTRLTCPFDWPRVIISLVIAICSLGCDCDRCTLPILLSLQSLCVCVSSLEYPTLLVTCLVTGNPVPLTHRSLCDTYTMNAHNTFRIAAPGSFVHLVKRLY